MLKPNEVSFNIGDSVYSPKFGLGKVLKVDFVEAADTDFYIIESFVNHTRLMVPVQASKKQLRCVATKEEASNMLGVFSKPVQEQSFESKKDRVKHFKSQQKNVVLKERVVALAQLHNIKDKGKVEKEIFQKMLDDISNEFSHALKLTETEVNSAIVQNLSKVA